MTEAATAPTAVLCCTSTLQRGGSERQMIGLLKRLDRHRVAPKLYLTYANGPLLAEVPNDVPLHSYARQPSRTLVPGGVLRGQVRLVRSILQLEEIVATYDRLYHTVWVTALAARGLPIRRIVAVVSPPSRDFGQSRQRWMFLKRQLLGWAYRTAGSVLAVSDETAADAIDYYRLPPHLVSVVPSPVDCDAVEDAMTNPPPLEFPAKLSEGSADGSDNSIDVAIVGRLSREKNHQMLLRVVADLNSARRPARLHIVGDGPLRDQLQRLSTSLGIGGQTTFYGTVDNPHAIISRCDALALPSRYEGFPNVVMEAVLCRVRVLASTAAGGVARLAAGAGPTVTLIDPDDEAQWRQQLACVDQPMLPSAFESAARYVRTEHDIAAWTRRMEDIFTAHASQSGA